MTKMGGTLLLACSVLFSAVGGTAALAQDRGDERGEEPRVLIRETVGRDGLVEFTVTSDGELTSFYTGAPDAEATLRVERLGAALSAVELYEAATSKAAPEELVAAQRQAEALAEIEITSPEPAPSAISAGCYEMTDWNIKARKRICNNVSHYKEQWSHKASAVYSRVWADHTNTVILHVERLVGYGDFKDVAPGKYGYLKIQGFKGWRTMNFMNPYEPGFIESADSGAWF